MRSVTRAERPRRRSSTFGLDDVHTHAAGGPRDAARSILEVRRVHVLDLLFGDAADLVHRQLADLGLVRLFGAGARLLGSRQTAGLLDQHAGRRRLHHERERTIGVDRDHHGDDGLAERSAARVEVLAEAHDVDPVLAERGTNRRRGVRLAGGELQLDVSGDFLLGAHRFSTWEKSSSTGVGRPKMETMTLSFCLSGLTSWTVPEKLANAPTTTRTSSPSAN